MKSGYPLWDSNEEAVEFCELLLIVRPEDKAAVVRVLEGDLGGNFTSFHAVGRGGDGGLAYSNNGKLKRFSHWVQRPMMLAFMPKYAFVAFLSKAHAIGLIEKISAALRLAGGPSECAGGFAIITAVEQEIPIGISPGTGAVYTGSIDPFSVVIVPELVAI